MWRRHGESLCEGVEVLFRVQKTQVVVGVGKTCLGQRQVKEEDGSWEEVGMVVVEDEADTDNAAAADNGQNEMSMVVTDGLDSAVKYILLRVTDLWWWSWLC